MIELLEATFTLPTYLGTLQLLYEVLHLVPTTSVCQSDSRGPLTKYFVHTSHILVIPFPLPAYRFFSPPPICLVSR